MIFKTPYPFLPVGYLQVPIACFQGLQSITHNSEFSLKPFCFGIKSHIPLFHHVYLVLIPADV